MRGWATAGFPSCLGSSAVGDRSLPIAPPLIRARGPLGTGRSLGRPWSLDRSFIEWGWVVRDRRPLGTCRSTADRCPSETSGSLPGLLVEGRRPLVEPSGGRGAASRVSWWKGAGSLV